MSRTTDALLVQHNPSLGQVEMEVLGSNGVFIFDLRNKQRGTGSSYALYDVLASYLTAGDRYRPANQQFVIASGKTSAHSKMRRPGNSHIDVNHAVATPTTVTPNPTPRQSQSV